MCQSTARVEVDVLELARPKGSFKYGGTPLYFVISFIKVYKNYRFHNLFN